MIYTSLLCSLSLTLAVELPIAHRRHIPLYVAVCANVITNPMVVLLFHWAKYGGLPLMWVTFGLEIIAVTVEGYLYKGYLKNPWRFSLLANGLSFATGVLLQELIV